MRKTLAEKVDEANRTSHIKKLQTKQDKLQEYTFIDGGNIAIRPSDKYSKPRHDEPPEKLESEFQNESFTLLIKRGYSIAPSPLLSLISNGLIHKIDRKVILGNTYDEYKYANPLIDTRDETKAHIINQNDCLKFAEAMSIEYTTKSPRLVIAHLNKISSESIFTVKDTEIPVGEDVEDNVRINSLKRRGNEYYSLGINNDAHPDIGEAYGIFRRETKSSDSPYHIAFVLYTENGVNITLEAEADNHSIAEHATYFPQFGLYDIVPTGYTFHRRWSGELDSQTDRKYALYNGSTVVLTPKDEPSKKKSRYGGKSKRTITKRKSKTRKTR